MSNEYQILGIPGAGKTTYLTKMINNASKNIGGENILVTSFTRGAAKELAGRDLDVPDENIGTMHSLCYRMIGKPELAEKHIDDFNKENPNLTISKSKTVDMDQSGMDQNFENKNDEIFANYQKNRSMLLPQQKWGPHERYFAQTWSKWKLENNLVDFTDMIENALYMHPYPPNQTTVGVFDEAQDFTPLQLKLMRTWAEQLNYIMVAGDDDQTIFEFLGANPKNLLKSLPYENKKILDKSYRVPRKVQEYAEKWINKIHVREPKNHHPRQSENNIVDGNLDWKDFHLSEPIQVCDFLETELKKTNEEGKPQSVMILAACSYMLRSIIAELKIRGIPFGNKYRRKNRAWNPLHRGGKGIATIDRILAYYQPEGMYFGDVHLWTIKQIASWIELLSVSRLLRKGSKKKIKEAATGDLSGKSLLELINVCFYEDGLNEAIQLDLDFLKRNAKAGKERIIEYPVKVINERGLDAVQEEPNLLIGSIHSVKGGQADHVVMFPDLSYKAAKYAEKEAGKDSVIRQFYVGMTRAREQLTIAAPASNLAIPI